VPNYFKYRPLFVGDDGRLSEESDERITSPISNGNFYLPNRAKLNLTDLNMMVDNKRLDPV
jgi:hypothetical protein